VIKIKFYTIWNLLQSKGGYFWQYGSLSKKLAKIGYFHKSGFESSIEEEISFSNI